MPPRLLVRVKKLAEPVPVRHVAMKKRLHVFYSGRVQGVGFRLTVEETAQQWHLTGWVKNLRDGRVEAVIEGDEQLLQQFLEAVQTGSMHTFIQRAETRWSAATGEFRAFDIRYF